MLKTRLAAPVLAALALAAALPAHAGRIALGPSHDRECVTADVITFPPDAHGLVSVILLFENRCMRPLAGPAQVSLDGALLGSTPARDSAMLRSRCSIAAME